MKPNPAQAGDGKPRIFKQSGFGVKKP